MIATGTAPVLIEAVPAAALEAASSGTGIPTIVMVQVPVQPEPTPAPQASGPVDRPAGASQPAQGQPATTPVVPAGQSAQPQVSRPILVQPLLVQPSGITPPAPQPAQAPQAAAQVPQPAVQSPQPTAGPVPASQPSPVQMQPPAVQPAPAALPGPSVPQVPAAGQVPGSPQEIFVRPPQQPAAPLAGGQPAQAISPVAVAPISYPPAQIKGVAPQIGSGKTYRLQVGAFQVPRYAAEAFQRLKQSGLDPKYEKIGDIYRVVVPGLPAEGVQSAAEKIGAAGFREALIREEG